MITELSDNRNELRAQVVQLTNEFLARGGQIQKIPFGQRGLDRSIDLTSTEIVKGNAT